MTILMAQVWHNRRNGPAKRLDVALDAEAMCWRATEYELRDVDGREVIQATPGAIWERFSPFHSYQATNKARALESGPHLVFLRLKRLWEQHQEGQLRLPHESLRQTEAWRKHLSQMKLVGDILKQSEQFRNTLRCLRTSMVFWALSKRTSWARPCCPG